MESIIKKKNKRHSGFSLLEMMVVIGIMGVIVAIALPALFNSETKASKAARELMGDMQRTRMSAIRSNSDWAIVFDPPNNQYLICSDFGADAVWSATADNTIEKTVSFTNSAAGIQYGNGVATTNATIGGGTFPADSVSYTADVLTFNSQGIGGDGYVYIFYGDASYAIGTLQTGIVRIKRWDGGAWR